jgi:hypothetical protein
MFEDLVNDPEGAGRLWERALLAVGDFLLLVGRNRSLLTIAQDEAWSWKRLLRNGAAGGRAGRVLKDLWDRLDGPASFIAGLRKIIAPDKKIDPWRQVILDTPTVYDYGAHRILRFSGEGGVYLLRKSQMNGRHAELFTYCLREDLRIASPLALTIGYYEAISTDEEPALSLSRRFGHDDLTFYRIRAGA